VFEGIGNNVYWKQFAFPTMLLLQTLSEQSMECNAKRYDKNSK